MTTTSYPGVYVEEPKDLTLSVNHASTAVPAIISSSLTKKYVKIDSWQSFLLNKGDENKLKDAENDDNLRKTVKSYFENGGGYCYIVGKNKIAEEIPKLDDVTLLVAGGNTETETINDMLNQCGPGKGRFAILDTHKDMKEDGTVASIPKYCDTFSSVVNPTYGAIYYPWLESTAEDGGPYPPSGAVAGLYCTVDRGRGVWKAPANVALQGYKPKAKLSDEQQGILNTKNRSINVIRQFTGKGSLIWGARTLADNKDKQWCYVPVRRLFCSVEKDIAKTMSFAMFEPNSQPTWERVRAAIDTYLRGIWRQGGLMGSSEKEAYYIHIGKGVTMTQNDIDNGEMIVEIGLAAVRPAEFIILRLSQKNIQG